MAAPARVAPEVRLDGLTTVLDSTPVLHRLSLTLPAGEITVLMGPSGAGKTTLVRHIVGLLPPDAGTVLVDGVDVWRVGEARLRAIRGGISVMLGGSSLFQTFLFASETASENVRYGLRVRGFPADRCDELLMARLRELDLAAMADRLPEAMPAHACKRLALARALAIDAPLLILDEIETGLDAAHREPVLTALRDQHARTGCTMLLTTHDLALARELNASLAILCNGRIVARGAATELLRGVEDNEQFERRFRISDFLGPPRLDDALAARRRTRERRSYLIDEPVLWSTLAGLLLVGLLAALFTVLPPMTP